MTRKIARLTVDNLAELPAEGRESLFWELDPVTRARAERAGAAAAEKEAWVSHVLLEWGSCGRVLYVDGEVAGFILYAPPLFFPGSASLPTAPIGEDAVQLATAFVVPECRGGGLGRVLMQAMAKDLFKRGGIRAVEAFGVWTRPPTDPRRPTPGGGGQADCVLPAEFLQRVGFKTHRPHPRYPRLRLELKSVLTWREEVELALERLMGAVVPKPTPAPGINPRAPRGAR